MAGYTTIGLLTRQAQNHYRNNGYVPCADSFLGKGENAYRGSSISKRFFLKAEDNDFFRLSRSSTIGEANRGSWFWLGWRVVVEYFDDNVLVDVQSRIEQTDVSRDDAVIRLAGWLSRLFKVDIVGDYGILDVRRRAEAA